MTLFRERDYFFCEYCGSFYFPPASTDGVRSLGINPKGMECPICQVPLQIVTLDNYYRGYQCDRCHGFLFDRITFRETVEHRRSLAEKPADSPKPLNPEELKRDVLCPACTQVMSTHPYLGPGAIVIDTCQQCNLIWLDTGELKDVFNAPGKDRGVPTQMQSMRSFDLNKQESTKEDLQKKWESKLLSLLDKFFYR